MIINHIKRERNEITLKHPHDELFNDRKLVQIYDIAQQVYVTFAY